MKTIGTPPQWATELMTRVCRDEGRRPPQVKTWRNSSKTYSSGHVTPGGVMSITAGTDSVLARIVLLHELAHHLTRQRGTRTKRRTWHGKRFWTKAWTLYEVYGVPLDRAWEAEHDYAGGGRWCPPHIRQAIEGGTE